MQLANGSEVTLARNKGGTLLSAPPREGDAFGIDGPRL